MTSKAPNQRKDEIRSALADVGLTKVDANILSQCVAVATSLHLSPKQMAESWEAFSLNRNLTALDDHSFKSYKQALIKDSDNVVIDDNLNTGAVVSALGKRSGGALPSVTPPAKRFNVQFNEDAGASASAVDSVASDGRRVSMSPAPPGGLKAPAPNLPKYDQRENAGKVIVTFDPQKLESMEVKPQPSSPKLTISYSFETNVQKPYRHMFTTLEERAHALDQHLVELGDAMVERYGLGREEEDNETGIAGLEAVGVPRQEKVCCIGRICNAAHEGRINATSVLLEGSRHLSGGARIELDLSHLKSDKTSYSLFPGQIVAVEGMNTSGRKMVAHRICEGAAHEAQKSTVKDLMRYHHDDLFQGGAPLKIMTASGPFTTSDNLEYEPLMDLVNIINKEKPDVVLLTGPFVDMRHQAVRSGQTTLQFQDGEKTLASFEMFFANKVAGLIEDLFSEGELLTQFVLVPSLEDATAEWVYPQPPFGDRISGGKNLNIPGAEGLEVGTLGLHHVETAGREGKGPKRVHCVSNPCTLKINEMVIGVTSSDALFHISADETNANLEPGSRLGRISQHMLQQRSYYPLFPGSATVNLDLKRMDQWKMPCQPDMLIIPSRLTAFARTVLDSTIVVNPGRLTRDTTGGSYALMEVHPIQRETLEGAGGEDVELQHGVHERTKVEIKRI